MKVDKKLLPALIQELKNLGAEEENPPPHALSKLHLENGVAVVYKSGSIVIGGKNPEEIKRLITFLISREINKTPRIGCDEAGKGEFVGPLVVACIYADEKCIEKLISLQVKDSKKLSAKRILKLSEEIKKNCHGKVAVIMPERYNKLYERYKNVNRLLESVYIKLISELTEKYPAEKIVIDKFSNRIEKLAKEKFKDKKIEAVPKADEKDIVVAAASIVAKGKRLKALKELEKITGIEIPEGNVKNRKLLNEIPKEIQSKVFKLHFNVS